MNLKSRAKQLKADIPAVFIAMGKKETPLAAKVLAGVIVCYALSPIDLIPDFVPVLGLLDDVVILPLFVALMIRLIPKDLMDQCRAEAQGLWADKKPQRWFFAIPVVLLWLAVLLALWLLLRVAT